MQLSEHEEKLLLRGLDKASAPAEVETAADRLFQSLRTRDVSGYDVLGQLEAGADYMPYESEGTPEWEEMRRTWHDIGRQNWQQQQAQASKNKAQNTSGPEHPRTENSSTAKSSSSPRPNPVPVPEKKPVNLRDSLMVWGSFLVAWLLTRNVIATLIVGFILGALWVSSRIFRRIVMWGSIAVAIIILFAILHSLVSSQPAQHLNTAPQNSALPTPVQNSSSPVSTPEESQPAQHLNTAAIPGQNSSILPDPEVTKLVESINAQPSIQEQIAKYKAEDQQTDLDESVQHATSFLNDWAPRAVLEQLPAPRAQRVSPPPAPRAVLVNPQPEMPAPRAILVNPYTPEMRARIKAPKAAVE